MKKGFLICFTGVDGSGKTTHAKSLMKYLKRKGYSCVYVWGASRPILSYIFFAFTKLMGYWKETKKNAYTNPLEYAPKKIARKFGALLNFFLFVDFHLKAFLKVRLPLTFGKIVICDRYFYDLLMELERTKVSSKRMIFLLSRTLPQPIITFMPEAPETLINKRREFPYEELKLKRNIFLQLAKLFNFVVIDTSNDFLYNQREIRDLVLKSIAQKEC